MYSVAVKIDGIESRRRSVGLLHAVIGFFMIISIANYYKFSSYKTFIPLIPVLLVASFSVFYGLFRRKLDWSAKYNYLLRLIQVIAFTGLGFLMAAVGKIDYASDFVFSFLCILLLFSERKIFHETTIFFTETGIKIPGYYRHHLVEWQNISEVVVREDFITFFHVKQKYLQYQVMQDLSLLEIAKMNAFCKEKIEGERYKAERPSPSTLNPKP